MKLKKSVIGIIVLTSMTSLVLSSCSKSSSSAVAKTTTTTTCSLTSNTSNSSTVSSNGCYVLTRDVTSCQSSREAQGLSGYWLKFSCRVTLTKSGSNVIITYDSQPDYKSQYFASTNACYKSESVSGRIVNPNKISAKSVTMTVPLTGTVAGSNTATPEGAIGVALNGVSIYDNTAAGTDDIYNEALTFDGCDGHPDVSSHYHYHTEPPSITQNDYQFLGVMRDGFPIYGKYDYVTGTTVTGLDAAGGKTSVTVDSPTTSVYHYHVNLQTSTTTGTLGQTAYFITTGYYHGTEGACTGCSN